jgi:hypothetical protein
MKTCPDKVWLNEPNSQSFQVVAKNLSGAFTAMKSGKGFCRGQWTWPRSRKNAKCKLVYHCHK